VRHDRSAARHDVAVPRAGDDGRASGNARLGNGELFHHRLGNAHGIDWIDGLVGREHDDALHAGGDCGVEQVLGAEHVGAHRLNREEFARRHLLEGRCMEHDVDARHRIPKALLVSHVADVELDARIGPTAPHIILLLLVAREDSNFRDVAPEVTLQYRVAEGAGATGDQECLGVQRGACHQLFRGAKCF
jgi:hypothetical protein